MGERNQRPGSESSPASLQYTLDDVQQAVKRYLQGAETADPEHEAGPLNLPALAGAVFEGLGWEDVFSHFFPPGETSPQAASLPSEFQEVSTDYPYFDQKWAPDKQRLILTVRRFLRQDVGVLLEQFVSGSSSQSAILWRRLCQADLELFSQMCGIVSEGGRYDQLAKHFGFGFPHRDHGSQRPEVVNETFKWLRLCCEPDQGDSGCSAQNAYWRILIIRELNPRLEQLQKISRSYSRGEYLDDVDLLNEYLRYGTLHFEYSSDPESGAVTYAPWFRLRAEVLPKVEEEAAALALLLFPAYDLATKLHTSQNWPRQIATCRAPSCGRRFYSGHRHATNCPPGKHGRRCKNEWEKYRHFLKDKKLVDPETHWEHDDLRQEFLSQSPSR